MDFIKNNIRWIGIGGILLSVISLFLPFATVSANIFGTSIRESVTYVSGDGILVLIALIIAGILLFFKKDVFSLICIGIAAVISVYSAINVNNSFSDVDRISNNLVDVGFDIGFYILFVGLIISAASVVYNKFMLEQKA